MSLKRLSMGFRKSSMSSRDMSDPQAYRTSDEVRIRNASAASVKPEISSSYSTAASRKRKAQPAQYKPGLWLYLAFSTLAILTIMVALDATALSVALPVSRDQVHKTDIID